MKKYLVLALLTALVVCMIASYANAFDLSTGGTVTMSGGNGGLPEYAFGPDISVRQGDYILTAGFLAAEGTAGHYGSIGADRIVQLGTQEFYAGAGMLQWYRDGASNETAAVIDVGWILPAGIGEQDPVWFRAGGAWRFWGAAPEPVLEVGYVRGW